MTDFVGERLRIARLVNGLSQKELAEEAITSATTISKLERGELKPSDLLLRAISQALHFEPIYFSREVRDALKPHECSFRHLQSTPKLLTEKALAKGTNIQEIALDLARYVNFPQAAIPDLPATDRVSIEVAAEECRQRWRLGLDAPISNMIRVAEHAGALVVRIVGDTAKVDAFSRYGAPPLIVLTSLSRQAAEERFLVAHELGHLVIHRGREVWDFESERQANLFAAAFLLPRNAFSVEFRAMAKKDWAHILELKRRWKVLASSIVHRADDLGLLSPIEVRRLYKQHSARGWKRGEPYDVPPESPETFRLAVEIAQNDFGVSLNDLLRQLGFKRESAKIVLDYNLPDQVAPLPANVARIENFRQR
jgi:Zn-dependent peptidase ImmA (M78 family)/DNA-binding XRE family transcriptional regulator